MQKLRRKLDSITMYRVVLYGLVSLTILALLLSALGRLTYSSFSTLSLSILLLFGVCFTANLFLGKLYEVTTNHESALITALILFFVLASPSNSVEWIGIGFAGLVAMASKYVITWRSSQIFNPAAFGVLIVSIIGIGNGAWWIADKSLFIPMLIIGYLVLLKLRRFELFLAFLVSALSLIIVKSSADSSLLSVLTIAVTLYPILFLGSIMLTEPSTMPTTRCKRFLFGMIVGLAFAANLDFGFITTSPHLALIIGNLFAFLVSARASVRLKLFDCQQMTPTTYAYSFESNKPIKHAAGQFMEFTLPNVKLDARGNRRTFTIASAPGSKLINIGVKFYQPGSQFKNSLHVLKFGDEIIANHVAGEFTLPKKVIEPIVLIAGGIGITPFISMIEEMLVTREVRPTVLYYFVSDKSEIAFKKTLKLARDKGIRIVLKIGKGVRLTDKDITDNADAHFYLSGPPGLVNNYKHQIKKMKINKIHIDYFTGY